MKGIWILLPALLLGVASAQARDTYCDFKGYGSPDRVREWFVTNEKVRTPQLPGSSKAPSGCAISMESVGGMYRPLEVVTKPKLGEFRTTHNMVYYRSFKNGEDFIAVRVYEVGRTGTLGSHVLQYRIHVVDRPL
jgi:hypothetical protein